jgi:MoaA/NifB/PqqE/SkfB family radical SAM enzyme
MTKLNPRPTPSDDSSGAPLPRRDPITRLPILILYPHSRCNCRCLMCDIWRNTTRDELELEDVSRWLDDWQALGVQRVVLSGGEALMHSRLWALCAALRRANIGITILSTGLLLKRHAPSLVQYCDDVVVSLDGPQPVHDAIRNVPRAFARLAEGVSAVKSADARVVVTGRCTVQRSNYRHLRQTVAAARDIGLDRISFLSADVSSTAFNRPEGWDEARVEGVALDADDVSMLATELDAMKRDCAGAFASGFIAESPARLQRKLWQYYAALLGQVELPVNRCNAPWVSSVIEADGTVRPCFFQPPLGNIHQVRDDDLALHGSPLRAILNAPTAIAWRQGLDVQRDDICRKCVCTLSLQE